MKKTTTLLIIIGLILSLLVGCSGNNTDSTSTDSANNKATKELKIGATAGPYSDMVSKAIKPILEKQGYKVEVVEFSDYVQPNLALANKSIDANLFQHRVYLEKFAADKKLELSPVIIVPTAPMGIYSSKYKSLDEIQEGSTIAIANDPTNLARTLFMLEDAGLIKIKENVDPTKASEKDIVDNPKNLQIKPVEAAQLPRLVESIDLSAVPGNFALAAKMNLLDALKLENMPDDYRNQLVVRTEDLNSQLIKDLKAAIESEEFEKVIDTEFKGFGKPVWMLNRK
ncbi:MetQ/NlpA family ABC transporter substrate-binding protein [Tepidibacillus marianensis]|uniref:MetQ/NlpA family ABC transporter substrate-binding protein n=1 Tax=Tepidibacillus marianensis TaxID=3131995 RepID=UPI0030D122C7